jgi:hypothetical protein
MGALADAGVRLGIVSNADGMMGSRLAQLGVCQVGPGIGVNIECVVDSGNVGARRAGIRPYVMDPLGLQLDDGYERISSLAALAELIATGPE